MHKFLTAIALVALAPVLRAQTPAVSGSQLTVAQIASRIAATEAGLIARMQNYHPMIEVYAQRIATDRQLGPQPDNDTYFLGQLEWKDGPRFHPIDHDPKAKSDIFGFQFLFLPNGFIAMASPDWQSLDPARYDFNFVRREFLGQVRCLVFDIHPKKKDEGFSGRIWVEERDFNIVRFNGLSTFVDRSLKRILRKPAPIHFDSWRQNVQPGVWLPTYIYSEESDLNYGLVKQQTARFRSQTRLWGYELKAGANSQEFTAIQIDALEIKDQADGPLSPTVSQRKWEQQAEDNVVDRLTASGLLAASGEVDRVLETVVNNIEATNKIADDAPIRCRVLVTTPLESFTIGHTIVVSRGLIDVLPDEASLATMLAHEVAHIALGHPLIDTKFAFSDRLMIPDDEILRAMRFARTADEENSADVKAVELLGNSPYKDRLPGAGLFLRALAARAPQLPHLVRAHLGSDVFDKAVSATRMRELINGAPELDPAKLDQIAALPLGGRLALDPWSARLTLQRAPTVPLVSAREKMSLMVSALMPFMKYFDGGMAVVDK